VERAVAEAVLRRLHEAQGELYAGGDTEPVRDVLTGDVSWHVPGSNAIAGSYRGIDEVIGYFLRRRALADNTFRLHPGEVMVGDGEHVAALTDGTAVIGGIDRRWSTVGLYRIRGERVAACWLLPLDPEAFDEIWSSARRED
jgi:hypothetical protein